MLHRVAYLALCPRCGLHAKIMLPDGSETEEFGSYSEGVAEVTRLHALGRIQADEAQFLREQIYAAPLIGIDLQLPPSGVGIVRRYPHEEEKPTLH